MFTGFCASRNAGRKIGNEDLEDSANISASKLAERELNLSLVPIYKTGITESNNGVYGSLDISTGSIYYSFRVPKNFSGTSIKVEVWWVSESTGDVKLTGSLACQDIGYTTASETEESSVISYNDANKITKSVIEYSEGTVVADQLVGLKLSRDDSDVQDTLSGDISIIGVVVLYNGRG